MIEHNPEPQSDAEPVSEPEPAGARVAESSWWCARFEDGAEDFTSRLAEAEQPYPRAAVARALSGLGARGWAVRHLSEERRVIREGASSRAEVVAGCLLLESSSAATTNEWRERL